MTTLVNRTSRRPMRRDNARKALQRLRLELATMLDSTPLEHSNPTRVEARVLLSVALAALERCWDGSAQPGSDDRAA